MSFSAVPTDHIAGYSSDGTNITIPIASLPELTAAEANASTGDIRKILYALACKAYDIYNTLAVANRPAEMVVAKNTQVTDADGSATVSVTQRFNVDISSEVADEPA